MAWRTRRPDHAATRERQYARRGQAGSDLLPKISVRPSLFDEQIAEKPPPMICPPVASRSRRPDRYADDRLTGGRALPRWNPKRRPLRQVFLLLPQRAMRIPSRGDCNEKLSARCETSYRDFLALCRLRTRFVRAGD